MNLSLGLGAIALIALAVAVVLSLLREGGRVRPFLYMVAGLGAGGAIADLLGNASSSALDAFARLGRMVFGTWVGLALIAAVAVYLIFKLRGKAGGPTKLTNVLAFGFPALLAAAGMGALVALAGEGVTTAGQAVAALIGDVFGTL